MLMHLLQEHWPHFVLSLPPQFWGPWNIYEGRASGFAYNIGFCFGLFFLPAFLWPRPRF
jgi:hypothetical protein